MRRPAHLIVLLGLAASWFVLAVQAAHAESFACLDSSGKLVSRPTPCSGPDARNAEKKMLGLWLVVLTKASCDARIPGFEERSRPTYLAWRKQFDPSVLNIVEQNPESQRELKNIRDEKNVGTHAGNGPDPILKQCESLLSQLSTTVPGNDSRFATPEKTWAFYLQSLRAGDRKGAKSCLTGTAFDHFAPLLERLSAEQMKKMADSVAYFKMNGGFDTFRTAVMARDNKSGGEIVFHLSDGNWLISDM